MPGALKTPARSRECWFWEQDENRPQGKSSPCAGSAKFLQKALHGKSTQLNSLFSFLQNLLRFSIPRPRRPRSCASRPRGFFVCVQATCGRLHVQEWIFRSSVLRSSMLGPVCRSPSGKRKGMLFLMVFLSAIVNEQICSPLSVCVLILCSFWLHMLPLTFLLHVFDHGPLSLHHCHNGPRAAVQDDPSHHFRDSVITEANQRCSVCRLCLADVLPGCSCCHRLSVPACLPRCDVFWGPYPFCRRAPLSLV